MGSGVDNEKNKIEKTFLGSFLMFFERPITATLLGISIVIVLWNVFKKALPVKNSPVSNEQEQEDITIKTS